MMEKAVEAIEKFSVSERDLSAVTLSIREDQVPVVKKLILEFRRQLSKTIQEHGPRDRVYSLAIKFFPLDLKGREESSLSSSSSVGNSPNSNHVFAEK